MIIAYMWALVELLFYVAERLPYRETGDDWV